MKTISFLIISMFLFSLGGVVFAQETGLPNPGLTPDSSFYFLEKIAEKIVTFFTFGDVNKAERYIALAAERLAEVHAVAEKGKTELMEETLKEYNSQLVKASFRIEKAKDKGKNIEEVSRAMTEAAQRHLAILEQALERAPEEVKPAIRQAMMISTEEGREMMAEVASRAQDASNEGALRALCTEQGGPPEMCEKIPLEGFKSFRAFRNFCLEAGGPPETCDLLEAQCREVGATTANECFLILSSVSVRIEVAPARHLEEN